MPVLNRRTAPLAREFVGRVAIWRYRAVNQTTGRVVWDAFYESDDPHEVWETGECDVTDHAAALGVGIIDVVIGSVTPITPGEAERARTLRQPVP
jgi:hypothetical protein